MSEGHLAQRGVSTPRPSGVYLFAFKPDATEAQKLYATTVLTAIASGSAGYAFGKKEGKLEKD